MRFQYLLMECKCVLVVENLDARRRREIWSTYHFDDWMDGMDGSWKGGTEVETSFCCFCGDFHSFYKRSTRSRCEG